MAILPWGLRIYAPASDQTILRFEILVSYLKCPVQWQCHLLRYWSCDNRGMESYGELVGWPKYLYRNLSQCQIFPPQILHGLMWDRTCASAVRRRVPKPCNRNPKDRRYLSLLIFFFPVVWNVRLQLKCDGARWRTGREVKGELAIGVCRQYPSRYLGTWCIQHYYRWCAHLGRQ